MNRVLALLLLLLSFPTTAISAVVVVVDGSTSGGSGRYEVSGLSEFRINLNLQISASATQDFVLSEVSVIAQRKNAAGDLRVSLYGSTGLLEEKIFPTTTVNQGNLQTVVFGFSQEHLLATGTYSIVFSAFTTAKSSTYTFSGIQTLYLKDSSGVSLDEQITYTFSEGNEELPLIPEPGVSSGFVGLIGLILCLGRRRFHRAGK